MRRHFRGFGTTFLFTLVGLTFGVLAHAQQVPVCTPPPANLVSRWPGDGNANDISGNAQNGAPHGRVIFSQGEVGQAFLFNGIDGRIEIPDSPIRHFGMADLTVDAWIKAPPSVGEFQGISGKEQQSFPSSSILLRLTDQGKLQFAVTDCGTVPCGWGGSRQPVESPFRVDDDVFHHVAGVRHSSGYELYVDGQLVATRLEPARDSDNTVPLFILGFYQFKQLMGAATLWFLSLL